MRNYPSYKPSGIEWIGDIPEHWNLLKIKRFCDLNTTIIGTNELIDKEVIHYSIPNVQEHGKGVLEYGNDILSSKIRLLGGEVLLSKLNPRKGCVTIVEESEHLVVGSGEFLTFIPKDVDKKYLFYHFTNQCFTDFLDSSVESVTRSHQRVSPDIVYNTNLPIPPFPEQLQIVKFLDEKTKLIDRLISSKKRKIELLKEQRTSLINQVVTKGLDSNVRMKDSGVEWIGEIPEHWCLNRLKYLSKINTSSVDKHTFDTEKQIRLCNYTDVYHNEFIDDNIVFNNGSCSEDEFEKFKLREGDVIITKDSETPDDIGIPSLVITSSEDLVCGYHLSIISSDKINLIGEFLFRQLQTKRVRSYFEINSYGITRFGLGKYPIGILEIVTPPIPEQYQIVEYLNTSTKDIDYLFTLEQRKIDLLKEYRQSLISEVVTGKIDVRTKPN